MSSTEPLLRRVGELQDMVNDLKRKLLVAEQALCQAKEAGETSEEGREALRRGRETLLQAIRKVRRVVGAADDLGESAKLP